MNETESRTARVIVIGNEKGGSGKSTIAIHLATALLRDGYKVGSIDLDSRQGTLTRFIDYRRRFRARRAVNLLVPEHTVVELNLTAPHEEAREDERVRFLSAFEAMRKRCDFIVIDTPGSDSPLSQLAHSYADTVVTPLNDSFIDLDVIARVDGDKMEVLRPSHYSSLVWEQKKRRLARDRQPIDWIVLRNRLSSLNARNKRMMADLLDKLSKRLGFRVVPGISERVVFRELYLKGLTVFDLREPGVDMALTMSHVAARQELRALISALGFGRPAETETKSDATAETRADSDTSARAIAEANADHGADHGTDSDAGTGVSTSAGANVDMGSDTNKMSAAET
jgi:chromosome partitioning protein